jgi:hypothetical protein
MSGALSRLGWSAGWAGRPAGRRLGGITADV